MSIRRVAFRCDASLEMGSGHVMRCLTLANALREQGADCHFLCRAQAGDLIDLIRAKGFRAHALPAGERSSASHHLAHSHWLGCSWQEDARQCAALLNEQGPDWLVVDHYALDMGWEHIARPYCGQLMVIDDLADRTHDCDLLLDQTFNRDPAEYQDKVPTHCTLICGSQYALLRPEFKAQRSFSLARRGPGPLREILVTLGGMDPKNLTGRVLEALRNSVLPTNCQIKVVMGGKAPALMAVKEQVSRMNRPTELIVDTPSMATLMTHSDLCIGAAGSTAWERCCLGLPTFMLVLAENQTYASIQLTQAGAAHLLTNLDALADELPQFLKLIQNDPCHLEQISQRAASICDGSGCDELLRHLVATKK